MARRGVIAALAVLVATGVGAVRWVTPTARAGVRVIPVAAFPINVVADPASGHVFENGGDGIAMLDAANATLVSSVNAVATQNYSSMAVDARRGRLIVAGYDVPTGGMAAVVDTRSGAVLLRTRLPMVPQGVVIDQQSGHAWISGIVPGSATGGMIALLDPSHGRLLKVMATRDTDTTDITLDGRTGRVFIVNPNTVSFKGQGHVTVRDSTSGRLVRIIPVGNWPMAAGVDERTGRVFVANSGMSGTGGNSVSILDAASGHVLRTVRVGRAPSAMAVDTRAHRVFVVNRVSGTVSVLDAHDGHVVSTLRVGPYPFTVAVDARDERIVVLDEGMMDGKGNPVVVGAVSVLDTHTGDLIRRVPLTGIGGAVAVDESSGHAFAAAGGSRRLIRPPDQWRWVPAWLRAWLPFIPPPPAPRETPASVTVVDLSR